MFCKRSTPLVHKVIFISKMIFADTGLMQGENDENDLDYKDFRPSLGDWESLRKTYDSVNTEDQYNGEFQNKGGYLAIK